jgi:hypothetical protein
MTIKQVRAGLQFLVSVWQKKSGCFPASLNRFPLFL